MDDEPGWPQDLTAFFFAPIITTVTALSGTLVAAVLAGRIFT